MIKLFDLRDIPEEYIPKVGGKARGLNSLIKYGYEVPEAFVIADIAEDEDLESVAQRYETQDLGLVSVRSSASLEDGKDFSAAGQFTTYLNIEGRNDVVKAVRDCVASLRNETVRQYSKMFLMSEDCRMNVIVQRMVRAKCAGVIFSRAPMRPGFVLVEAVVGLGENLVSGKMSAQQYRVRGNDVEVMPSNPILTKEQAVALGEAGKRAEKLFGMPMDLEWAIDENDCIQWLQARPITIGESVTMNELDCEYDASRVVYTTGNIGEVMPGAITPLNISTNLLSLDWAVMKTYVEIGCFKEELPPYHFIATYYNHAFFNMSTMYAVSHSALGSTKETMDISICGKVFEDLPDSDMPDKPFLVRLKNTIPFIRLVLSGEKSRKGMIDVVSKLHFDYNTDMNGLYRQIIDNFKYMKMAHYYHYGASYYSGGATAMLNNSLEKKFKDKEALASTIAGCLTQIDDFESADILRSMRSLAELMVKDNPSTADASVPELMDYFDHQASGEVKLALDAFMERHGYRGILENEIMNLPWRDNRESFCTSIRSVLASIGKDDKRDEKAWTEYAEDILSNFSGLKKKSIWNSILKARKGVTYREFTKSKIIYVLDQFKQAYRALSEMMVDEGILPERECIYFLTQDEVGLLLAGDRSLVKKALARKRIFPQQMELRFPYAALGVPQPISAMSSDPDATVFHGTPVSRGIARGVARVVRSESDAMNLQKGEIMIAACTDIGWSPYYSIIGGLVTEIGSALSHGVVVAREYALPTVVNVTGAMDLINNGDRIVIDGNTGTIVIEKRADNK